MSLKWYLAILIAVILLLPAVIGLGVREWPSGFQPSSDGHVKIFDDQTITQEISPGDRFSGVAVSLKNPNLINKEDLIVRVLAGDQLVREVVLTGRGIADGNYVKIRWPAIDGSNQRYQISFSSPSSSSDIGLGLVVTDNRSPELGVMTVGTESAQQAVAMVSYSKPVNPLAGVMMIYQGWMQRLSGDWLFVIVYLLLVGGCIVAIVKTRER